MPTQTNFAKLYMYDDAEDAQQSFLSYRTKLSGTTEDSNMQKIDKYLSEFNDMFGKFYSVDEDTQAIAINATTLNDKDNSYFENVASIYNANCVYQEGYILTLENTDITISSNIFTLRFIAPSSYIDNKTFKFNEVDYTPVDTSFEEGQVVLLNFDSKSQKCYSSSGGTKDASKIETTTIDGISSTNVQGALAELKNLVDANSYAIPTKASQLTFENSDNSETNLQTFLAQQKLALDAIYQSEGNLEGRVEQNETNISSLTETVNSDSKLLSELSSWASSYTEKTNDLEKQVSTNTGRIDTLETTVKDIDTILDTIVNGTEG
jgi:hypothetical protein